MKISRIEKVTTPSPRGGKGVGALLLLLPLLLGAIASACSDDTPEYDPYYDWQARNAAWFRSVADSAHVAILEAQAQYGDQWPQHCQWRQYKTLTQAQDYDTHRPTDSIYVRILGRGTGTYSPTWSDSVRISHRGWLMPTTFRLYNAAGQEVDSLRQQVFDQTYYGPFDPETAAPALSSVSTFTAGFATALQYMVQGDDWLVYVPSDLAYGDSDYGSIPGHSTLLFRIHLAAAYPAGSGAPTWKAPRRR